MAVYRIVVYLHVLGVLGWFLSMGVEAASLTLLARARDADAMRAALSPLRTNRVLGPIAALLVLVPGVYMAESAWSAHPTWVGLGYLTFFAVFALGAAVTGRATLRFERALKASETPTAPLSALRYSLYSRVGLLLGVTFAMVVKPGAIACVLGVLLGSAIGLACAAAANRGSLARAPAAATLRA